MVPLLKQLFYFASLMLTLVRPLMTNGCEWSFDSRMVARLFIGMYQWVSDCSFPS